MYTGEFAFIDELNARIQRDWPGSPWKAYPNTADFDRCVMANDPEEIVSQVYMSNYDLKRWSKYSWWRPELLNVDLEAMLNRRTLHDVGEMNFYTRETRPTRAQQKRLYEIHVKRRKTYELLRASQSSSEDYTPHGSVTVVQKTHRSSTRKRTQKKL